MPRPKKEFTEEQIGLAKAMFERGDSIAHISKTFNIHFETAKKLVGKRSITPVAQRAFQDAKKAISKQLTYILEELLNLPPADLRKALDKVSLPQRITMAAILSDKLVDKYENEGKQKIELETMADEVQRSLEQTRAAKEVLRKILANNAKPEEN